MVHCAATGELLNVAFCEGRPFGRIALSDDGVCVLEGNSVLVAYPRGLSTPLWRRDAGSPWSSYQPIIVDGLVIAGTRGAC